MAQRNGSADGGEGSMPSVDSRLEQKNKRFALASRRPRKISVTIPQHVYELLLIQSESQGRSLSSLASYWLQLQASREV